ncbi:hypothetical protein CJA_3349 [Cellvibrio japonicus Ueda107]|uniref:Uncharacterized protein n=1 Tax=Cellvibrio japonicus (strain Ueda107) TaxID=498211 RepID=B3PF35_CELJU|nr:hypothetical protein CJA_3349 [Cellvibrio japonicus Ueda107]
MSILVIFLAFLVQFKGISQGIIYFFDVAKLI